MELLRPRSWLATDGSSHASPVGDADSAPAGVISAFADSMESFEISDDRFKRPKSLRALANTIGDMARAGFIIVLDEFQYFARSHLGEFTSHLQAVVDGLSADAARVRGGLFVLGSLHTELVALLEDRSAPLYNRTTDNIELDHLDVGSVLQILANHGDRDPMRLLFLWNLFEGVPKFYRDCFEHGVLGSDRKELLRAMFFRSSSPLKTEADNWFLSELRGRYDVVLKFVARNPGCTNGEIRNHAESTSSDRGEQIGGYLKILIDKYRMVDRASERLEDVERDADKLIRGLSSFDGHVQTSIRRHASGSRARGTSLRISVI